MAKTAERKVEIAQRIKELACDEHGLDPELLIFDVLTFTLTTGDEEWRPSRGRDDRGHPPASRRSCPASRPRWASPTSPSASRRAARAVLNSVFLHHCVEAGLDLAMVNPNHITPYGEISEDERELADDLVFNRREDALERFIAHFESKGEEDEPPRSPTRPRAWSPRRRCTGTSCAARRTASRTGSTARSRRSARSRPSTTCCCRR